MTPIPASEALALRSEAAGNADALAPLEALEITSAADLAFAGELLTSAKSRWKELEEKRTAITRPINEAKRQVDALFAPAQEPLKRAEGILKAKIAAYTIAQQAAQTEAMLAVSAGEAGATLVVPSAPPPGVSVRSVWDFEVTDDAAVPRELLSVDEAKVRKAIWYADTERAAPRPIPGLRFFLRGKVTVRT